jgi:hypothetical protein
MRQEAVSAAETTDQKASEKGFCSKSAKAVLARKVKTRRAPAVAGSSARP